MVIMHGFYLQKEIYKSGKITGAVRIMKGHEILPDDSTLVQYNISDGDTVNIVIEPDKQITVEVICKLGTFKHEISNSILVRDLKQKLIDCKQVAALVDEFDLHVKLSDTDVQILDDHSLTLHEYGIWDDCKLLVERPYIFLALMNQDHSRQVYKKVDKRVTVAELKKMITQLFCDKKTDILMFVTNDQITFVKVDSEKVVPVNEIMSDGQTVCYLEDKRDYDVCYPVKLEDVEVGKVYGDKSDTVKIIKLRVQNQLDIAANLVTVTKVDCIYEYRNVYTGKKFKTVTEKVLVPGFPAQDNEVIGQLVMTIHVCESFQVVVRPYLFLTLINKDHSKKVYKKLLKQTTVGELKKMIVQLFCDENITNIYLFVTNDQIEYVKVGPNKDMPVAEIFSDGQVVCYLEDKSEYSTFWPVKRNDVEIGRVYGDKEDTVDTVKLRIQDQLNVPASCISVSRGVYSVNQQP